MPTNFDLAEAAINFTAGTEATWNAFVLPIPENVVVYTVDTKKFKKGDGNHRFSELEDGPSIAGIASGEETVVNVLTQLEAGDEDSIIAISNEIYDASATKLNDLIARLNALANSNTVQTANMDAADLQFGLVNSTITNSDNGKLAVVIGHDMSAGILPDTLSVQAPVNPINIRSIKFYTDSNLKNEVNSLYYNGIYYADVHVQHDTADIDDISIELTEGSDYVTVEHIERGLFKIVAGLLPVTETVQFTATATYNVDTVTVNKSVSVIKYSPILVAVYGGLQIEGFQNVVIDSSNNIYAAGYTVSEGSGGTTYGDALIVKFDNNLNIIARKRYGGTGDEIFYSLAIDASNNIYGAGWSTSAGNNDALIVKFDSSLNVLASKIYSSTNIDRFYNVGVDLSSGNIYAVGYTDYEGTATDALIVKFDSSLNVLAKKYYGGSGVDAFESVTFDSSGNVYVGGATRSEGTGIPTQPNALIVKFNSSLTLVASKIFGGSGYERILTMVVDSSNNIYCFGDDSSEGISSSTSFIIKFDSSLNVLLKKRVDSSPNLIRRATIKNDIIYLTVIFTINENIGSLILKLDTSLNILAKKFCSVVGTLDFSGIRVDSLDNIWCVGSISIPAIGLQDTIIVKFPSQFQSGTYNGEILNQIVFSDITNISISDSLLTPISPTTLTLNTSTIAASTPSLTLADSALTLVKDIVYCH